MGSAGEVKKEEEKEIQEIKTMEERIDEGLIKRVKKIMS